MSRDPAGFRVLSSAAPPGRTSPRRPSGSDIGRVSGVSGHPESLESRVSRVSRVSELTKTRWSRVCSMCSRIRGAKGGLPAPLEPPAAALSGRAHASPESPRTSDQGCRQGGRDNEFASLTSLSSVPHRSATLRWHARPCVAGVSWSERSEMRTGRKARPAHFGRASAKLEK